MTIAGHGFRIVALLRSTLAAITIFSASATAALAQEAYQIAPGVIVDGAGERVFLMRPGGGLEAVAAQSGAVLWSSNAAAKPLAVRGGRLIAQVERTGAPSVLHIAALDRANGAVLSESQANLGVDVFVSVDDPLGAQFLVGPESYATEEGAVVWRYVAQPVRAMPGAAAPVMERFGALQFDAAGRASAIAGGFPRASGRAPFESPRVMRVMSETPAPQAPIIDMESGGVFRLDGGPVLDEARQMSRPPGGGLFISEGAPVDEFPPMRRLPGDQFGYSSDQRYILASAFVGPTDARQPYRWYIFQRRSYERFGSFRSETSIAPFMIVSGHIIFVRQPYALMAPGGLVQEFPLAVVARDLTTGREAWMRPLRETRYLGPLPP